MNSQRQVILNHLTKYGSITSLEAINAYGVTRLSAVIFDLRHAGHPIRTDSIKVPSRYGGATVAKYVLVPENYPIINRQMKLGI